MLHTAFHLFSIISVAQLWFRRGHPSLQFCMLNLSSILSVYLLYSRWQYHQQHIVIFKYHRNYCALGSHAISWTRTAFTFVIIFLGFCMQVAKPFIHINGEFLYICISLLFEDHSCSSGSCGFLREHVLRVRWDGQPRVSQCRSVNQGNLCISFALCDSSSSCATNSTHQVCGWKSSLNFLNLALTMTISKVSHDFTISPFSMILHPGRVLLTSQLLTLNTYSLLFSSAIRFTLSQLFSPTNCIPMCGASTVATSLLALTSPGSITFLATA